MKFRTCLRVPNSMSTHRESHTHTRTRTVSHMHTRNGSTLLKRRRSERRMVAPGARTLGVSWVSAASGSSRARSQQVSARSPGGPTSGRCGGRAWRWGVPCGNEMRWWNGRWHGRKGMDGRSRLGRMWCPSSFGRFEIAFKFLSHRRRRLLLCQANVATFYSLGI